MTTGRTEIIEAGLGRVAWPAEIHNSATHHESFPGQHLSELELKLDT